MKEEIISKLTWKDIREIANAMNTMLSHDLIGRWYFKDYLKTPKKYYTEVLRRLNEKKED